MEALYIQENIIILIRILNEITNTLGNRVQLVSERFDSRSETMQGCIQSGKLREFKGSFRMVREKIGLRYASLGKFTKWKDCTTTLEVKLGLLGY